MKLITAEGIQYRYFAAGEQIPSASELGIENQFLNLDSKLKKAKRILPANTSDLRLVIVQRPPRDFREDAFVYYLHWDDGTDLGVLDQKVEIDTYSDADFERALLVEDSYTLCNRGCHYGWETLIIHPEFYVGILPYDVARAKVWRRKSLNCLNCNAPTTHFIAKFTNLEPIATSDEEYGRVIRQLRDGER
jgi:hypothetical protein